MGGGSSMRVNAPDYTPKGMHYGQQPGGAAAAAAAAAAMGMAMPAYSMGQAPHYAYASTEVTWVPVLTPGGVGAAQLAAGGYGQPFIAAVDPNNPAALYYAPAAAAGQQAAVYATAPGGSAPVDITASIANAAAMWKPPPPQQPPQTDMPQEEQSYQAAHR
eukprot:TRINITY_DN35988_c0_g2_i1.p2 TRINITY_DN35988_c0_g2~~TRINITY_DN35988_c0_g2_i1.p2  ORF type:complete len:169 (-),score=11.76 TRINITY_DN35988_c0_g2_i1:568-1050(-)